MTSQNKYLLLDANVVVGYYLPRASTEKVHSRMTQIVATMKTRGRSAKPLVLFVPNFCVAEVFNVFRKYRFGKWNPKVKANGSLNQKDYTRIYRQFQNDIHNGGLFYHYELSRYHLLNTALVSPIDHHYAFERQRRRKQRGPSPMSTFDLLIVGIGIELVRLHGRDAVRIVTTDDRIKQIMNRAASIEENVARQLGLFQAARLVGKKYSRRLYPLVMHLGHATQSEFGCLFEDK